MKLTRLFISLLLLIFSCNIYAVKNKVISDKIDSIILNQLPAGTDVALMVYDLTNDTCIYAYRDAVLSRPASVMKVITSTAALSCLGADYNFETTIRTTGTIGTDSVLNGDVYIVGDIDPLFMEQDMKKMIADMKAKGINRIDGTVYADISVMDSVYWGSGWSWDDTPASFQPYISPLMVHGGYVGISVAPTRNGQPPKVSIYPQNNFIKVENTAITGNSKLGPLTIRRDWLHNDNTIIVSGNSVRTQATDLSIVGSADFFFSLFKEYLASAGICATSFGWAECPAGTDLLAKKSRPLTEVINEALKESNNLCAEAMFLHLGKLNTRKGVTFKDAIKYEENFLKRIIGVNKISYNIADGSGLSMYDYVSPSTIVGMLAHIYRDESLFNIMYKALPVSGVDGTLRGRMGSKNTFKKVHAKTGTLTGSCTLAGYAKGIDGRDFAFCIMNEGAISMAPSRKVQDAICTVLCE
ncbi:MAG: D-alanyl-D-alanine carboxypeptidase/D-alanyl-D-alanine-endopeptidase [Bacteroidaceae bacterium]|nr:D-alanyl-D-alanine carboxypeptidase/D-alanyl-D-alanine-endopeptidase [Bacteroidaceae bacterium]MBO7260805.1 D-alanyl-D-alanine carboxypeptidase/D-alanyl-D-alanine-endopeptidase [Bacteroidaceae bacterium]